jgi:methylenetetrahydrofolate dehydrogenase (NADP+) / methenyltetrahydrofolate cyclohydrolase
MQIIDGKKIAAKHKELLRQEVKEIIQKNKDIGLGVILVGNDAASKIYVSKKEIFAKEIGVYSKTINLPSNITEKKLINEINKLNDNKKITGILIQLPLPAHINERKVCETVKPEKDVDGFHNINLGKLVTGDFNVIPCTPYGILTIFQEHKIDLTGKFVVIIGRSNIVSKPLANILVQKIDGLNATVCVCHSKTKKLKSITKQADVLITAIGIPEFIDSSYVKNNVIVIDVGINRIKDTTKKTGSRLCGDVKFKSVSKKVKLITPVPGGVGPLTIVHLFKNLVKLSNI